MTRPILPALCAALLAAGCTAFPQLDATVSEATLSADYPALLSVADLRAAAAPRAASAGATTLMASANGPGAPTAPEIDARAARLRARAAGLQGDVIDAAAKDRLNEEITIDEEDV